MYARQPGNRLREQQVLDEQGEVLDAKSQADASPARFGPQL
jgi:hypothetical protein